MTWQLPLIEPVEISSRSFRRRPGLRSGPPTLTAMSAVPGVDWRVAVAAGRTLVPPGLDVSRTDAAETVADLRACAGRAVPAVAAATGLAAAPVPVLIVDRAAWVRAATDMAESMLTAVGQQPPVSLADKVGGRLAGAQLGAALAFVACRILGQFDPYSPSRRLLLVAPNIVAAERAMGLPPTGFRQWVCLHEQTHAAQFGAAPWLPAHLLTLMAAMFAEDDGQAGPARTGRPADRLFSGAQLATFDQITAVMSLLEGHADVIMDRAATGLVPQVEVFRAAMENRRDAPGPVQLISRLLGLRAKRDQYLHGASFCREVIAQAGMATLNRAFAVPELLPTLGELHDPERWLQRVPQPVG